MRLQTFCRGEVCEAFAAGWKAKVWPVDGPKGALGQRRPLPANHRALLLQGRWQTKSGTRCAPLAACEGIGRVSTSLQAEEPGVLELLEEGTAPWDDAPLPPGAANYDALDDVPGQIKKRVRERGEDLETKKVRVTDCANFVLVSLAEQDSFFRCLRQGCTQLLVNVFSIPS